MTNPGASPGASPLGSPGQPPLSPGDPAHILHGASPTASHKESGKGSEDGDSIFSVKGISSELPFDCPWLPAVAACLPCVTPLDCPLVALC